MKHPISLNVAL